MAAINLPADLPTDWDDTKYMTPNGVERGLPEQYGMNHLGKQVNAVQEAANQLYAEKTDGGKPIQFSPTLITSDGNQDFSYGYRVGHYVLTGDMCHFLFGFGINNMSASNATGDLRLVMPVPYARESVSIALISYFFTSVTSDLAHVGIGPAGVLTYRKTNATGGYFNISQINKNLTSNFQLNGQISYFWR